MTSLRKPFALHFRPHASPPFELQDNDGLLDANQRSEPVADLVDRDTRVDEQSVGFKRTHLLIDVSENRLGDDLQ